MATLLAVMVLLLLSALLLLVAVFLTLEFVIQLVPF